MIQYPLSQAQDVGGKLSPVTNRVFKGVNTYDSLMIDDTYFTDSRNLSTESFPAVSTRPGYSVLGTYGTAVLGIGFYKSELHAVFNDGTWRRYNGSWTTLASGLSTTEKWAFTVFQGAFSEINLIGANGVTTKRYNGSMVADLTGAPAGLRYVTTYSNRIWGAVGKELHSCQLDNAEVWNVFTATDDDPFIKDTESMRGEDIQMLSGSLSKLTIGMRNALFELYGDLTSNFSVKLVVDDVGVLNNESVCTQRGMMRIIDEQGIYDYSGGTIPDKEFSDIVGGYLGTLSNTCAGADVDNLYFKTTTNTTLVYDSRTGVNAWSVWSGFNPTAFASLDNQMYVGDSTGRVLKLEGLTDGGTAIAWYAITKPFTNASIAQKMRWYKMFVVAELAEGSTFKVELSKSVSGSDWETVQNITGGGLGARRIIIPVSKYAIENYIRVRFSGTGYMKMHEYTRVQRQLPLY